MFHKAIVEKYLTDNNLGKELFCAICKISTGSLALILKDKKIGPLVSKKIYIATKGKLNLNVPYLTSKRYYAPKNPIKTSMGNHKRKKVLLPLDNGV